MLFKVSPARSLVLGLGLLSICGVEALLAQREDFRASDRLKLPVPQIETVVELPRFGEGVVFDRQGRLFISDAFNNVVWLISETGEAQVWANVSLPNGHKVLADGIHVVMEQAESGGAVVYLNAEGQIVNRLRQDEQGRMLRSPNDIAVDLQNGGFYFTDPGPFMADAPGRIYYVNAAGQICTVSDGEVDFPNGIVLRPDGNTLLVAESLQNRVLEFLVEGPCQLGPARIFATLPSQPNAWTNGEAEPDGMALDKLEICMWPISGQGSFGYLTPMVNCWVHSGQAPRQSRIWLLGVPTWMSCMFTLLTAILLMSLSRGLAKCYSRCGSMNWT